MKENKDIINYAMVQNPKSNMPKFSVPSNWKEMCELMYHVSSVCHHHVLAIFLLLFEETG
jgi:hypothetical protein